MNTNQNNVDEELFIRILDNKASHFEEKLFNKWLQNNNSNLNRFLQFKSFWENLDDFPVPPLPDQQKQWEKVLYKLAGHEKSRTVLNRNRYSSSNSTQTWIIRAAAIIIFTIGIFFLLQNKQTDVLPVNTIVKQEKPEPVYNTLITKKGEKRTFPLPDGSIVYLNSGTKLTYPNFFAEDKREVEIDGEAYFIVHHNKEKPFLVKSGNSITQVTGTEFNIYNRNKKVRIVVSSGSVKIHSKNSDLYKELKQREMVTIDANGNISNKIKADLNFQLAWRDNKLSFSETSLSDVMEEIERCFNVKVVFKDNAIKDRTLTGIFEVKSLPKIISLINLTLDLKIAQEGQNLIIK